MLNYLSFSILEYVQYWLMVFVLNDFLVKLVTNNKKI